MTVSVSFSVDGPGMCQYARDLMLSERPGKALQFVASTLLGDREGALREAQAVLDGTLTFENVGPATFRCVEETEEVRRAYRASLDYIYAGRVRLAPGSAWWRPVAVVAGNGGVEAMKAAASVFEPVPLERLLSEWRRRVVEYHAYPEERAVRVGEGLTAEWVIFEPCGDPPAWWPELDGPDEAFAAARAAKLLETRNPPDDFRVTSAQTLTDHYAKEFRRAHPDDQEDIDEEAEAARQVEYAAQDLAFEKRCQAYGDTIRARAAGDMFELVVGDTTYQVPRAPFENWALGRTGYANLAPHWEPVAPSGLKLYMDDPYHTDWMLGAGIPLTDAYGRHNEALHAAAYEAMWAVQNKVLDYDTAVVLDKGPRLGTVGEDIAVIPHLGPEYIDALKGQGIITESGGALAHLAVVGLEKNVTIMRVTNAALRYPVGTKLYLDPDRGRVFVRGTK